MVSIYVSNKKSSLVEPLDEIRSTLTNSSIKNSYQGLLPHTFISSGSSGHIRIHLFLLNINELKYLRSAITDSSFTLRFIHFLKLTKKLPAVFILSPNQHDVCDNVMWSVACERLVKSIVAEESLAWLSTLGGGYSSLGEGSKYAAILAGTVSLFQMRLAVEIKSPLLMAKSQLWFAQSLMQRGYLRNSANLLRHIYYLWKPLMTDNLPASDRIDNIAIGLWARLRYLWSEKRACYKDKKSNNNNITAKITKSLIDSYPLVNILVSRNRV